jgi:hypothetical protein
MKKTVFFLIIAFLVVGSVFAQSYTVQEVKGRVQKEAGGSKVDLKVGDTLSADTIIHTGVGASLVLQDADKATFTVPAAKSGKVADLTVASSGVRARGSVVKTDTDTVSRTTGQVSTASARASEAIVIEEKTEE